jgi:putative acetyltransferase
VEAPAPRVELRLAEAPEDVAAVRELMREYAASLAVDLCFQDFERELAALPGGYAAPTGALLLALVNDTPAGCVAMRPLPDSDHVNACEMKRLFVRRAFRQFGLGRRLTQQLMDLATQAGHSCMLLDTLDDMETSTPRWASSRSRLTTSTRFRARTTSRSGSTHPARGGDAARPLSAQSP